MIEKKLGLFEWFPVEFSKIGYRSLKYITWELNRFNSLEIHEKNIQKLQKNWYQVHF